MGRRTEAVDVDRRRHRACSPPSSLLVTFPASPVMSTTRRSTSMASKASSPCRCGRSGPDHAGERRVPFVHQRARQQEVGSRSVACNRRVGRSSLLACVASSVRVRDRAPRVIVSQPRSEGQRINRVPPAAFIRFECSTNRSAAVESLQIIPLMSTTARCPGLSSSRAACNTEAESASTSPATISTTSPGLCEMSTRTSLAGGAVLTRPTVTARGVFSISPR